MQLFVKTLIGKTLTLEVEPTDTIEAVKQKIHEQEPNISKGKMTLMFGNKSLEEGDTLQKHGIEETGTTVHLVV